MREARPLYVTMVTVAILVMGTEGWSGMNETTWIPHRETSKAMVEHEFFNISLAGNTYTGHVLVLTNPDPVATFGIYPPYPGGCNAEKGAKAYTSTTATAHRCVAATNAGFFDVATGACIGPLVSQGEEVVGIPPGPPKASFGLLYANATAPNTPPAFFVGYPESVEAAGFAHLVSGVGWLIREGISYVNTSIALENIPPAFVAEPAPRLMVGHNAAGHLLVVEVDGNEIFKLGPNLVQMAALALHFGFHNAINLDGGGSDTVVLSGSTLCSSCGALNQTCADIPLHLPSPLPSPPPDYPPCLHCGYADPAPSSHPLPSSHPVQIPLCQRLVTSITCMHDP